MKSLYLMTIKTHIYEVVIVVIVVIVKPKYYQYYRHIYPCWHFTELPQ